MKEKLIAELKQLLTSQIRRKLAEYSPEPHSMPFHTRLLGADRMAIFSFIHSLNTNFGTAIFEPVAVAMARGRFKDAKSKAVAGECISQEAQRMIQEIMNALSTADIEPNQPEEVRRIRAVCQAGKMARVKLTQVDVMLEDYQGVFFLFDLKTAKPNIGNFKEFKRTLLEWTAAFLSKNPQADVRTAIAIPSQSLILFHTYEEGQGKVAQDSSGNGNNGVLKGGVSWTPHGVRLGGNEQAMISVANSVMLQYGSFTWDIGIRRVEKSHCPVHAL